MTAADSRPVWKSAAGNLTGAVRDFLWPPVCVFCSADDAAPDGFCDACRGELLTGPEFACPRCGAGVGPHAARDAETGCVHCAGERFAFSGCVALGTFSGRLKQACLRGKEATSRPLLGRLGESLAERVRIRFGPQACDWIVPVPTHWRDRISYRRQQSAAVIAEAVARSLKGVLARPILVKRRRTESQRTLPPSRRRTNLRDAFRLGRGCGMLVRGATVLLVDDVLTTGTTAHRASRCLLQAGAAEVRVAVLARGVGAEDEPTTFPPAVSNTPPPPNIVPPSPPTW